MFFMLNRQQQIKQHSNKSLNELPGVLESYANMIIISIVIKKKCKFLGCYTNYPIGYVLGPAAKFP